jgi:hypothetical protein
MAKTTKQDPKGSKSSKSYKGRGKGYKPKQNPKDNPSASGTKDVKDGKPADGYEQTVGSNAFAWHTGDTDGELLRRASKLSWSYQAGGLVNLNEAFASMSGDDLTPVKSTPSGILVIRTLPTVGGIGQYNPTTRDVSLNLPTQNAANTLLTEMRSRTRVRNTYNAPDVLMQNIAMANIYAAVSLAKRLAGTARYFTYENHYLPEILYSAQGFLPGYFKAKQYDFVNELNELISEINKIYVPNRMHWFELLQERYECYYSEGDDIKDQLYVITPAFLSSFELNPSAGYSSCVKPCMTFPGNWQGGVVGQATYYDANHLWTGEDLLNCIRYMLAQVLSHDEWADIAGDMQNAFGPGERWLIPDCNPDALAPIVRDEEILETIHNMSWSSAVIESFYNYTQTVGVFDPTFCTVQDATDNSIGTYDLFSVPNSTFVQNILRSEATHRIIDVHSDPNEEKTFAITRLRNATGPRELSSDTTTIYVNITFSTDLICGVDVYTRTTGGPYAYAVNMVYSTYLIDAPGHDLIEAELQPFHYRPLRQVCDGTTGKLAGLWPVGETDVFTQIPDLMTLQQMNRISLLSLLGAYSNM